MRQQIGELDRKIKAQVQALEKGIEPELVSERIDELRGEKEALEEALAGIGAERQEAEDEELIAQLERIPNLTEGIAQSAETVSGRRFLIETRRPESIEGARRMSSNPLAPLTEQIADGVWRHAGDIRRGMNVYLVAEEDGSGVFAFDAGTRAMAKGIRKAAGGLGGLRRVVLGHSHVDHRGSAVKLGVPVYCHPDEIADAEGDAGVHYQPLGEVPVTYSRWLYRIVYPIWDAGPVTIAGTLAEGERIAGFEVIHFPGHAPGQIGLWRESDRLCLCSDTVYLTDSMRPLGHHPGIYPPHPVFDHDTEQTLASVRKLASLEPTTIAPGHLEPLRGERAELRARLEKAADERTGW